VNKIKKVIIFCHANYYNSKFHFSKKLQEALERQGVDVLYLNFTDRPFDEKIFRSILVYEPDLTLSFNTILPDKKGCYLWEYTHTPHLSIFVDPSIYYLPLAQSRHHISSCVDELDVLWLQSKGIENSFFLPHAIERDLHHPPESERPYDIVLLGSSYDEQTTRDQAQKVLSPPLFKIYEKALKRTEEEAASAFEFVVEEELKKAGIEISYPGLHSLCSFVDYTLRGKERVQLVRSFEGVNIHIFGYSSHQDYKTRSWPELLESKNNVIYHPPVEYGKSLDILKQAKFSLNSMPFFKKGTHERIFASLAAGAVPITNRNLWLQEHFEDDKDLLAFNYQDMGRLNEKVKALLTHPQSRNEMAQKGQTKTLSHHTWDERVATLLKYVR
jgi:spore maturation protein CgeB